MKKTECALVQDLIPNYLEQLTSEETNVFIKEHVTHCRECKKILEESTRSDNFVYVFGRIVFA